MMCHIIDVSMLMCVHAMHAGGSISSIIRKYRKHAEALNPALLHRPPYIPMSTAEGDLIHNPHGFAAATWYDAHA